MKKLRNKFSKPRMIWDTTLIAEDKAISSEYGLRRKREIWAAKAVVRDFRRRARELNALKDKEKEKSLLEKINKLGLIKASTLDDVLSLTLKNILDRRLQTLVFRKGFSTTVRQARQLIVHGHVSVDGQKTMFPSYIVPVLQEDKISVSVDVKKTPKPPAISQDEKKLTDESAAEAQETNVLEEVPS